MVEDEAGSTFLEPILSLPAKDMRLKLIGTEVALANAQRLWAIFGKLSATNAVFTQHFLTASFFTRHGRFDFARYFDPDVDTHGPLALAPFLGLEVAEVFPISYDVSAVVSGDIQSTKGQILAEPISRLSKDERWRISNAAARGE